MSAGARGTDPREESGETARPERVDSLGALAARLLAVHDARPPSSARGLPARSIAAVAGAPGSGKSTLAAALLAALGERAEEAVIVPMDGFHLDDARLEPAGLLPLKGSPPTFDVGGLRATLERIAGDAEAVFVPLFDRERELSRAAAGAVEPHHRLVIVEGNYLLLARPPWDSLAPLFDQRVLIDVPPAVLRERIVSRWLGHGFAREEALRRAEENDLPNGALVRAASAVPDLLFVPDADAGTDA